MPPPPITTSNIPLEWNTSSFTVLFITNETADTFYTTDGSNPITSGTVQTYTGPFVISDEGITTVIFYSKNTFSVSNFNQTQFVKIDKHEPLTQLNTSFDPDGTNGWYISLPSLELVAIDTHSGVDKTFYSWNGGSFVEYTVPFTIPSEGIHYLQYYSKDNAGNIESVHTREFRFDNQAPTTDISSPESTIKGPVTIEFITADAASGAGTTFYTLDGSTPTVDSDSGSSVVITESGTYTLKFFSVDVAGNVETVNTTEAFNVEVDTEVELQVFITESAPMNGLNGWYLSSPFIGILTTRPQSVTSIQYKINPEDSPTTATYTSTVEITGLLDLSDASEIALEVDQSGDELVINIRGTDASKTSITDIIDKINATFGGDEIAKETGSDGQTGTGYITLTSLKGGLGDPTAEIKFVDPVRNDATNIVFGLDIENYPHTFTETYLFQDYTVPFQITGGDNVWEVTARASDGTITAELKKIYYIDGNPPVTSVTVTPDPNVLGFYNTSPDITFSATDTASGVLQICYQFNNGPVEEFRTDSPPSDPVQFPGAIDGVVTLRFYSIDRAGNQETVNVRTYNFDDSPPTTLLDYNSINYTTKNIWDIIYAPTLLLEYNPYTQQFTAPVTDPEKLRVSYFARWTNDLNSLIFDLSAIASSITIFDPIDIYLVPIDDLEIVVEGEMVVVKDETKRAILIDNPVLKHVIRIFNVTTNTRLTYRYFSDNAIYTVENFLNSDVITVDYVYTKITATHYTIDGTEPTEGSAEGHIISLVDSGVYPLKYFSIDAAGNHEPVVTYPATIILINRAPIVSCTFTFPPDGTNGWYKTAPSLTIDYFSPNVFVFNEDSIANGTFTITTLKVDPLVEEISTVTRIYNQTTAETYTLSSFTGNQISFTGSVAPLATDVLEVDYTYRSIITNGDVVVLTFTFPFGPPSPFVYNHSIQGDNDADVTVRDARLAETTKTVQIKYDSVAPVTTDDTVPMTWVDADVDVTLTATDTVPGSGVFKIYYTTDGTPPTTGSAFFTGDTGVITLTNTGSYTIRYFAVDNAGNAEALKTAANLVLIDKTAPSTVTSVIAPDGNNGWYIANHLITLVPTDLQSGIDQTFYRWDETGLFLLYTVPFLMIGEGEHTLEFYSTDIVGNVETTNSEVFKLDTGAPVTIDNIPVGWTNQNIFITVTDTISGNGKVYYTLDGTNPTTASAFTTNQIITVPVSGIYTVKYFGEDFAGNIESPFNTAANLYKLDLEAPIVVSIDPPTVIFTTETHLTIDFTDALSGVDVNTVRIVVDDIEYSTTKHSAFFTSSGTPNALQVKIGPVASIPNFDVVDQIVIYATDFAGNELEPVVILAQQIDTQAPYIKGFWPKKNAIDVSRDTHVAFFIDDDISGVDLKTVEVTVVDKLYKINCTDVMTVTYTGTVTDALLTIEDHRLIISVGGITITNINLGIDGFVTVRNVSDTIDALTDFTSVTIPEYDQEPSLSFVDIHRAPINPSLTLAIARFEDNKNINYSFKSNGYLIVISPSETFDDRFVVNVKVDATDFYDNVMVSEEYYFTCRDITTPARELRDRWYQTHLDVIKRIRSNLESTYNKRSDATIFHGYLKSLALEIGRAQQEAEDYRDDTYYDGGTTRPELLYQNLGYLLKHEPQDRFTHERYREMLFALMKMYFEGSLKDVIATGIADFLGVEEIIIRELVREDISDISDQFMFTMDIDLGSDPVLANIDTAQLTEDLNYVMRNVKPAHTFFLLRYIFSEIIRTKDIIDELFSWSVIEGLEEDMRTDCADKNAIAEIIRVDVSSQFDGTNNCATVTYAPILTLDETTISEDPADVELIVYQSLDDWIILNNPFMLMNNAGFILPVPVATSPISIISVNGVTGEICLSRNPLVDEVVIFIYKFNKHITYREISFYLNTYTLTGSGFDPGEPYLLNQINPVERIIKFVNQEPLHAHICETDLRFIIDDSLEDEYKLPTEYEGYMYLNDPPDHFSRVLNDPRWVLRKLNKFDDSTSHLFIEVADSQNETLDKPDEKFDIEVQQEEQIDRALDEFVRMAYGFSESNIDIIPNDEMSISTSLNDQFLDLAVENLIAVAVDFADAISSPTEKSSYKAGQGEIVEFDIIESAVGNLVITSPFIVNDPIYTSNTIDDIIFDFETRIFFF